MLNAKLKVFKETVFQFVCSATWKVWGLASVSPCFRKALVPKRFIGEKSSHPYWSLFLGMCSYIIRWTKIQETFTHHINQRPRQLPVHPPGDWTSTVWVSSYCWELLVGEEDADQNEKWFMMSLICPSAGKRSQRSHSCALLSSHSS